MADVRGGEGASLFPWRSFALFIVPGLPALAFALRVIVIITDPAFPRPDSTIEFNGQEVPHVVVVGADLLIPFLLGAMFGAIAVWRGLRLWSEINEWRRRLQRAVAKSR